jgi:hypothetical protein
VAGQEDGTHRRVPRPFGRVIDSLAVSRAMSRDGGVFVQADDGQRVMSRSLAEEITPRARSNVNSLSAQR